MRHVIVALALLVALAAPTSAAEPFHGHISQGFSRHHPAIDIAAHYGTIVHSIGWGTVVFVGWRRNCGGWQVYVDQHDGTFVGYYHLSRILVDPGDELLTGSRLGKVGSSGCTTGPHTHIEVWRGYPWLAGSVRINPAPFIWPTFQPAPYRGLRAT